jgi:dipeptidyl aminopeptidase/acylaminoacyl peptidase
MSAARWVLLLAALLPIFAMAACGYRPLLSGQRSGNPEYVAFSSDDGWTQTLWIAEALNLSDRRPIASFSHRPNWSGGAGVSPDGRFIAFTVLPADGGNPDSGAELRIVSIESKQIQTLALGVDLRSTLIWTKSGNAVAYQRFRGGVQELLLKSREGGHETSLTEAEVGERLVPLEVDDASALVVVYDGQGASLNRAGNARFQKLVALSGSGATRDFELSPDGKELAFLTTDTPDGSSSARLVALDGSTAKQLPSSWGEIVGVAWDPFGRLIVGSSGSEAGLRARNGERLLAPEHSGFLQPLRWSPSGRYLAVRAFTGQSSSQPGNASDELLTTNGRMQPLTDSSNARFIGWATGE